MIDLELLRQDKDAVVSSIKRKDPHYDIEKLIELDEEYRSINRQVEDLRSQKNELSKNKGAITPEVIEKSRQIGKELKDKEGELDKVYKDFRDHYLRCPNIIGDDVPNGNKESNLVVKTFGEKPKFDFEVKNHVQLGKELDWFDFEAGARLAKARFPYYKKEAVNLMYALTRMMLKNNIEYGYEPALPPYLVNEKSLEVASNFPKFRDQVFEMQEDDLFLIPTSEVSLANLYRDQILNVEDLPIRLTSWTSCFRREAGTYGSTEQGLIRIHQFEKVELFALCKPEDSDKEHAKMIECAENILQKLGLHYRVSLLAAQDCSFPSAKTYDIEVWMPGQGAYYEVSSGSNCTDFQARRGLIRYRREEGGKTHLVHTLNCSSLALPRLVVALMETYQQKDGSIKLPDVLKEYSLW